MNENTLLQWMNENTLLAISRTLLRIGEIMQIISLFFSQKVGNGIKIQSLKISEILSSK